MSASGDAYYRKQQAFVSDHLKMEWLNARLNWSEMMLRNRIGDQKVDDLIDRFMAAGKADRRLFTALYKKRDPYRWLAQYWAPRHERTQKGVEVLRAASTNRTH